MQHTFTTRPSIFLPLRARSLRPPAESPSPSPNVPTIAKGKESLLLLLTVADAATVVPGAAKAGRRLRRENTQAESQMCLIGHCPGDNHKGLAWKVSMVCQRLAASCPVHNRWGVQHIKRILLISTHILQALQD